jgi:multidrug efflux pump subunit AcrB
MERLALMARAYNQAQKFGAEMAIPDEVARLECEHASGARFRLTLSNEERVSTRTVVIASGARYRRPAVEDLADTRLAPRISQLPGVGLVSISGGQKPSVRIQANPTALAIYGLNLEDLRTAIVAANVNLAKGSFSGPHQAYTI